MIDRASYDDLMRYLDDELPEEDRGRVGSAIESSTELQRELALFRAMKEDFQDLSYSLEQSAGVWDQVSRRLARPTGWVLLVAGTLTFLGYGAYVYFVSPADLLVKLATGAVVIGVLLLLASVMREQYKARKFEPYRDVQR